jgi:hypothetical protein
LRPFLCEVHCRDGYVRFTSIRDVVETSQMRK